MVSGYDAVPEVSFDKRRETSVKAVAQRTGAPPAHQSGIRLWCRSESAAADNLYSVPGMVICELATVMREPTVWMPLPDTLCTMDDAMPNLGNQHAAVGNDTVFTAMYVTIGEEVPKAAGTQPDTCPLIR